MVPSSNRWLIVISIALVLSISIFWFSSYWYLNSHYCTWEVRGQLGDSFGAVNALFSGLAFAGIIVTILLQRQELGEQRKQLELNRQELELTREEMKLARSEYQQQNETLSLQRFENTFFQLLNSFETLSRRNVTNDFYDQFSRAFSMKVSNADKIDTWSDLYETLFEKHLQKMELYINSVSAILALIEAKDFPPETEKFYYLLVHSKLTTSEMTIWQYHSRLTYQANHALVRRYLKKLTRLSGRTQLNEDCWWLFKNYDSPRDENPWDKDVFVEDL